MISKLKIRKLISEYRALRYELAMVEEILEKGHLEFEKYYRRWCAENDVDIDQLGNDNKRQLDLEFIEAKSADLKRTLKELEEEEIQKDKYKHLFKEVAKKVHPDRISSDDSRYWELNTDFKFASDAKSKGDWGRLLDIAEKHGIYARDHAEASLDMRESITKLEQKINKEKSTYSWKLHECEDDENCKQMVVKNFLLQLFGWKQ
tara:strand:+ start:3008 stop:3622 length:615 start_codon:yes stop_codon:yes gene_type:complete